MEAFLYSQMVVPEFLVNKKLHLPAHLFTFYVIVFLSFRLFNVYMLWLEDENFQKGDTYIPSLPKHYDIHRLAKVMQNQQVKP